MNELDHPVHSCDISVPPLNRRTHSSTPSIRFRELSERRTERRRRKTANPHFSSAAVEERRRQENERKKKKTAVTDGKNKVGGHGFCSFWFA